MLARAQGVNVREADQAQERGDGADNLLAQHVAVAFPGDRGGAQRGQHADGDAGVRAGRVDGKLGGVLERQQPLAIHAPFGQAIAPGQGRVGRGLFHRLAGAARHFGVEPGLEILRGQVGEMEQEIGQVALGVNHQGGDALQGGLFQQGDAQAGLAGTGHSGDDGVGGQVGGVVEERLVEGFASGGIEKAAEVEFVIRHGRLLIYYGCAWA